MLVANNWIARPIPIFAAPAIKVGAFPTHSGHPRIDILNHNTLQIHCLRGNNEMENVVDQRQNEAIEMEHFSAVRAIEIDNFKQGVTVSPRLKTIASTMETLSDNALFVVSLVDL